MRFKKHLSTIQTIMITFITLIAVPAGLAFFIDYEHGTLMQLEFEDPIILTVVILTMICYPLSVRIFNAQMQEENYTASELFGRYTSALAVKSATMALPGVFAAIVYLINGNIIAGIMATACLLFVVRSYPSKRGVLRNLNMNEEELEQSSHREINEN